MISQNRPLDSIIPTLGFFVVAAFRLMPSANRLLSNTQNLRYFTAAFENLHNEFSLLKKTKEIDDFITSVPSKTYFS